MIATLVIFGPAHRAAEAGRCCSPGARWSAARCSSRSRCRSCCGSRRICDSRWTRLPTTCGRWSRNFVPVFISRGVVQVSAYVDQFLASLLPTGAVAGLTNAQLLYTLPVSLFGMSVSAAELPAMSGAATADAAGLRGVAAAAQCRPAADRVLRRAVGDGVPGARRRRRRRAAADRTIRARRRRATSGASSPAPRSGCWRRRSAGSTRRPTTRCAIRGRRCGSRSSASC